MLRTSALAAVAALITAPAFAANCSYGSHSSAAAYSAAATTAYTVPASTTYTPAPVTTQPIYSEPVVVEPASVITYTDVAPAQPATITYVTAQPDIVDTAVSAGSFNTLVAAVKAAGLVDTLKGPGPFTVFAPTDEAFAALPAGTVENLLKPENRDQLASILTYHVVPGKVLSSDLVGKQLSTFTVQGSSVDIDATAGVRVGSANVVTADVETSNGVIHIIDSVLIPGT